MSYRGSVAQGYHNRAIEFLNKYQAAQAQLEQMEREAADRIPEGRPNPRVYEVSKLLEVDFWYKRAVSLRNGYQLAANTYFLAAISTSLLEEPPIP